MKKKNGKTKKILIPLCFILFFTLILIYIFLFNSKNNLSSYYDESSEQYAKTFLDFEQVINISNVNTRNFDKFKINFRTIHALCNDFSDPDCYSNSTPFIYEIKLGKIQLIAIRLENSMLLDPSISYFQYGIENVSSASILRDLDFSVIDYTLYGRKTNLFLNLELEQNKTYCFQVNDVMLKSELFCQNFTLSPISFSSLKVEFFPLQEAFSNNSLLVIEFPIESKERISEFLKNAEIKIFFPTWLNKSEVHFGGAEMLRNLKLCNQKYAVHFLVNFEKQTNDLVHYTLNNPPVVDLEPLKVLIYSNNGSFLYKISSLGGCNRNYICQ